MCHHFLKIRRDIFAVRRFSILATGGRFTKNDQNSAPKLLCLENMVPQNPHTPLVNHDVPHSIAILWLDPTAHVLTNSNVSEFCQNSTGSRLVWPRNSAPCHGLTNDSRFAIRGRVQHPFFPMRSHEIPGIHGNSWRCSMSQLDPAPPTAAEPHLRASPDIGWTSPV